MLPLYVRNTLLESNGTTLGGDQNQDVMATDRRYSHVMGRVLNRFEPDSANSHDVISQTGSTGYGLSTKKSAQKNRLQKNVHRDSLSSFDHSISSKQSLLSSNENRMAYKKQLRNDIAEKEKVKSLPLSQSLVRLVFAKPSPSLNDLHYLDENE